ncbi:MAG: hypothetical protein VB021_06900 [Oscillospiraceae bacterium]|nr:hypothetical protein [Oscillospiraceae bacterium]
MAKAKPPLTSEEAMQALKKGEAVDLLSLELPAAKEQAAPASFRLNDAGTPADFTLEELLGMAQECLDGRYEKARAHMEAPARQLEQEADLSALPELREFVGAHPELTQLPEEVLESVRGGKGLMRAYADYENAQLKEKLRAYEQNEQNRRTSAGSVRGDAGDDAQLDELLRVFNAVFY